MCETSNYLPSFCGRILNQKQYYVHLSELIAMVLAKISVGKMGLKRPLISFPKG
jgi:hypothetical protein